MFKKLGISSAGIDFDHVTAIRLADETGFESIDIDLYVKDGATSIGSREVAAIKSALASSRLNAETAHASFFQLGEINPATRKTSIARLKRDVDVACELGLKKIVIHPTHNIDENNYRQALNNAIESVYHLIEHAGTEDFMIVLENVLGTRDVTLMLEAIDSLPAKNTGICFDNGHALLTGFEKEIIEDRANRVVCVHLHDNDMIADRHRLPFQGDSDWDFLIPRLNNCNTEILNLEVLNNPLVDSTKKEYLRSAYARGTALLSGEKDKRAKYGRVQEIELTKSDGKNIFSSLMPTDIHYTLNGVKRFFSQIPVQDADGRPILDTEGKQFSLQTGGFTGSNGSLSFHSQSALATDFIPVTLGNTFKVTASVLRAIDYVKDNTWQPILQLYFRNKDENFIPHFTFCMTNKPLRDADYIEIPFRNQVKNTNLKDFCLVLRMPEGTDGNIKIKDIAIYL